jgi:hypothetical protein
LRYIAKAEVATGDRVLVELERAMALLELGRYVESNLSLERAAVLLGSGPVEASSDAGGKPKPAWRPESHERVLIHTMEIANHLALQDVEGAAGAADRAVETISEVACARCEFTFTRVLVATAYGEVGRFGDGLAALRAVQAHGGKETMVASLRRWLEEGVAGAQPAGFAPLPVSDRTMVAILLLGRGPYKAPDRLAVNGSETIDWTSYLPRDPQVVTWAQLEGEGTSASVELTAVEELAVASLRDRGDRVVESRAAPTSGETGDLRHWSTLPASLQVVTLKVPQDLERLELVYMGATGNEIDGEVIDLPPGWTTGRLYITRRMP